MYKSPRQKAFQIMENYIISQKKLMLLCNNLACNGEPAFCALKYNARIHLYLTECTLMLYMMSTVPQNYFFSQDMKKHNWRELVITRSMDRFPGGIYRHDNMEILLKPSTIGHISSIASSCDLKLLSQFHWSRLSMENSQIYSTARAISITCNIIFLTLLIINRIIPILIHDDVYT